MTNTARPDGAPPDPAAIEPAAPAAAGPDTPPAPAANDATPTGPRLAQPTPEPSPESKLFEVVRLKARLSYLEQENEKLKGEIDRLQDEPAEYQDKNVRLLAEMENLRRRTERERTDIAKYAITRFARDVLTIGDNMQRAIGAVPPDAAAVEGPLKQLLDGVVLTERELLKVLEGHGVTRIDPTGERFDPNQHQAMMEIDNPQVPAGTVVQAFQPAYLIEDRVLRPAMVVVSKGGPKVPKAGAPDATGEADAAPASAPPLDDAGEAPPPDPAADPKPGPAGSESA